MIHASFSLVLVALAMGAFLPACGGSVANSGPGDGDSSGDGDGDGDLGDGDSGDGDGDAGDGDSGDGDGDSMCSAFDDDEPAALTIQILNETSEPIFIGPRQQTCGGTPMFSIERDGMTLPYFEDGCSSSCQQLRDDGYLGCPDICLFSATVRLEPGEIYTEGYNGLVHVPDTLPVECVTAPGGPADDESCFLRRQLSTGPTTFSATAGSAIDCDAALSPVGCECEPHPQGGCAYSGVPVSGDDLRASVEVDLGRDHGVYDGDQDVSSGAVTPIKIVFSN